MRGLALATLAVGWMLVGGAGTTTAESCAVAAGQYFDADPTDAVQPAIALSIDAETCIISGRPLARPGADFDPYIGSYLEEFTEALAGPPPYDNPYGCPFAPGDRVDLLGADAVWRPAIVTASTEACEYTADVYSGASVEQVQLSGFEAERLRDALLPTPTESEMAAARLCPPGGRIEDHKADETDGATRRAIIAELSQREKTALSVYFESFRRGAVQPIRDGGTFLSKHPDAPIGGEVYPVRTTVSICKEGPEGTKTSRSSFDFNCFSDKFGDYVCRVESERAP